MPSPPQRASSPEEGVPRAAPSATESRWCAGAGLAIGGLALVGWLAGVPALRTFVPGWASLKVNTALLLVLLGGALWALPAARRDGAGTPRVAVRLLGGLAAALAALTLLEHATGVSLGIDEALVADAQSRALGVTPGRPAAATALNALLQSAALLLASRGSRAAANLAQWLAAAAALLALVAIAGLTYGLDTVYATGLYATAAPHTSVTLLALAVGVMLATPEGALTRLLGGRGAARIVLQRFLPLSIAVPWVAGYLAVSAATGANGGEALAVALVAGASMLALGGMSLALAAVVARREDELAVTLRSIGDGVIVVDGGGVVTELNPVAEELTGWRTTEARGAPLLEVFRIVNEETRAPAEDPTSRVLRDGVIVGLANHTLLLARDGRERAIADSCAPIRDDTGALLGAVLVFRDQTQERAAAAAQARADAQLDCAPLSIALLDAAGRVTHVNAAWRDFAAANGAPPALVEGVGEDYLAACRRAGGAGDELADRTARELEALLAGRAERFELEYPCHGPTTRRWFRLEARAVRGGEPGAVVIHGDVTHRHLAEMRLQVQDSVARALARRAPCREVCRDLVRVACDALDWDVGELWVGGAAGARLVEQWVRPARGLEPFADATRQVEAPRCDRGPGGAGPRAASLGRVDTDPSFPRREAAARCGLRSGFAAHVECDGARACLAFFSRIDQPPSAELLALFESLAAQIDEVAQRAEAEAALARSEARFRALFSSSHDALLLADGAGPFEANAAAVRLFGCADPGALLAGTRATAPAGDAAPAGAESPGEMLAREVPLALAAGARSFEWMGRRLDSGKAFPAEVDVTPIELEGRTIAQVTIRDLTAKKELLGNLMQMERLASMGALAAGVGHEINNPLSAVVGNLDLALQELERRRLGDPAPQAELAEMVREAREAAERVRAIARDLKVFARSDQEQTTAVDLHRVLDSTLRMAGPEVRHRARVVQAYGDPPPVEGTEARLGQVFLNLVLNASHAIAEGASQPGEIHVTTGRDADGGAVVSIRDTGCGMSPEVLANVFEPFFTTKPAGVGTGLGLPIVARIVGGFGGRVDVESELGRGSTFTVRLPAARSLRPPAPDAAVAAPRHEPRGRVLVVDDEPMLCKLMDRLLGGVHAVETTTRAEEALRRIIAGERYDAIVCDLMLPGMTGAELHARLRELAPDQAERMVFVTGGVFTASARGFLEGVGNLRLEKPVDADQLRAAVASLLR
ncbi:MAG: PAS domain S-box protein [Polyangiaceae bacterium]|nr:PAS domain S-box protein [Polyangiaceae bacterium]